MIERTRLAAPHRPLAWMGLFFAFFLGILLPGCNGGKDEPEARSCAETTECDFGQSCLDGLCTARTCATSDGCPIGSFCKGGSCDPGCETTDDCYPDEACNEGVCEARGCRNTTLDCSFGEFCDIATGDCYAAGNSYCEPCVADSSDADQCGSEENLCLSWGQYGDFCGVECDNSTDCPVGYDCIPVGDNAGNIFTKQCITYCWLYGQEGERPAARPLPPSALPECPTVIRTEGDAPAAGAPR